MAVISKKFSGLENDKEYFARVFVINPKGCAQSELAGQLVKAMPMAGVPLSTLAEGAVVVLMENGVAVPFCVSKRDYESGLNGAGRVLVTRKRNYTKSTWHSSTVASTYSGSRVDTWLNSTYLNLFNDKTKQLIGQTKLVASVASSSNSLKSQIIEKSVFLLSMAELGGSYSSGGVNSSEGTKLPTVELLKIATNESGVADSQWTRTMYIFDDEIRYAIALSATGATERESLQTQRGIRPSFTLPAETLIDPQPNADGSYNLIT